MSIKEAVHLNMRNLQFRVVLLVDTVQKLLALALLLGVLRQQSTWASHTAGCTEPLWCQPAGNEIQKRGYLTENIERTEYASTIQQSHSDTYSYLHRKQQ